jgi:DNA-binding XRE family transcriptional regulator
MALIQITKTEKEKHKNILNPGYAFYLCTECNKKRKIKIKNAEINNSCRHCRGGNYKHGLLKGGVHRTYRIWKGMMNRCDNKKNKYYHNYGGRGITYCDDWNNYENFYKWALSNGYNDNLQIDRIDNDGNYCPENCRFVTHEGNSRKTRSVKLNWVKVDAIRDFYKNGATNKSKLGRMFGVTSSNIKDVINNKIWHDKSYNPPPKTSSPIKLGQDKVNTIRELYLTGKYSRIKLAEIFNVTKENISLIVRNKSWFDVDYTMPVEFEGIKNKNAAKLDWDKVNRIRKMYSSDGCTQYNLADEFGVSKSSIGWIIKNKTWHDENYIPPNKQHEKYKPMDKKN